MRKRVLWLALVCVMLLAMLLASCGKSAPATTTATSKSTQTQTQTTTSTTVKTTTAPATTTSSSTLVAPTTTTPAGTAQYGGILRIGDYALALVIGNPAVMTSGFGQRQARPAIETLMRIDKTGAVTPWLVKSWTTDAVAMTITLTLNTGIMFSDSTPFNAAAVKWNLDRDIAAKQTGTNLMKSVDVVNDNTVNITLTQWDNTILDLLGSSYIGMIISPTTAQKHDANWIGSNPVGTGPFTFDTWIPQVTISYTKNPNYWQPGEPYVDRVENVIIVDQTVGQLNFKAGKTDMFVDPLTSDVPNLVKTYPNTTILPFAAYATVRDGAIFDSADPTSPFGDVRVRQAAQYAVNMDEMNKVIFGGVGQVTNQWITKDSWGYDPTITGYSYNPDKAKQLLADAGYGPGNPVKTTFIVQSGAPQDDQSAAIKGYFAAVGINLTLQPTLSTALDGLYASKWHGIIGISTYATPDPAQAMRDRYAGLDARYYANMLIPADYKAAVLNACSAPDFATKLKYVQEADKLFTDKYCLALMFAIRVQSAAKQNWLHNDGLYKYAASSLWAPEGAWKDAGH